MSIGIELKNHISLTSSHAVANITQPIKNYFGITYFNYVKLYRRNNNRLILTDRADWIDYFYKNALYNTQAVSKLEKIDNYCYHLWNQFNGQPSFVISKEKFNIDNGITIIEPNNEYTELYYFGTTAENTTIVNSYLSKFDILQRFILYFKDKAYNLISQSNRSPIYIPEVNFNKSVSEDSQYDTLIQSFFNETRVNRIFLDVTGGLYFTIREASCLYLLLLNNTAKEIAKILGISPRTAESYLNTIKNKLNVTSKKELINTAVFLGLRQRLSNSFMEFKYIQKKYRN